MKYKHKIRTDLQKATKRSYDTSGHFDIFNKKWIKDISPDFDRYPAFPHIYNLIVYYIKQKHLFGEAKRLERLEYSKKMTDKLHEGKHRYICFKADREFYDFLKITRYSERTIKRYISAYVEMGILKMIRRMRDHIYVYGIGFFVENEKGMNWYWLLRETSNIKKHLKNLDKIIK